MYAVSNVQSRTVGVHWSAGALRGNNLKKTRPVGQPDPQDPTWRLYCKSLIKLALDCGGVKIFSGIEGLQ